MKLMYVVVMTLLISSCQSNKNNEPVQELAKKVDEKKTELTDSTTSSDYNFDEKQPKSDESPKQKPQPTNSTEPFTDWTQKIIKTANISVELKDYHAFNNSVHHSLATYGAYIAQEQQQENDAQIINELSIKVPVEQFESLINFLTADKKNKLLQKQITSSDVTAEYADTRARVETKKQVREKYRQFLGNANKIDDVLAIQSEINAITEDIEAAAGRVKYLSHQATYSTINLRYFQVLDPSKANDDNKPGFFAELGNAFEWGASFIGRILIALASVWPLLVIACTSWVIIKRKGLFKANPSPVKSDIRP
jgi:hypothetical protein